MLKLSCHLGLILDARFTKGWHLGFRNGKIAHRVAKIDAVELFPHFVLDQLLGSLLNFFRQLVLFIFQSICITA